MAENTLEITLGIKNKTKKKLLGNFQVSFEPTFLAEKSKNGVILFNKKGDKNEPKNRFSFRT
jgi:hypothetical protein